MLLENRWPATLMLAVLITAAAVAQSGDGEVTGLVKDPTGAPIAAAALKLVNADSGVTRSSTSDGEGRYKFVAVPPGRYTLHTEAAGFKSETTTGFVLTIGARVDHNVALAIGSVQEAVTVSGDVPPIDTSKAEVAGVVTQQQIDSLPVNTRQFLNLALLMPGTTQDASRTFYNNVQLGGGGRFYANGFSVDGVTNTWAEQGEPRQNIPQGAVQEFKVNTNQFKAEATPLNSFATPRSTTTTNSLSNHSRQPAWTAKPHSSAISSAAILAGRSSRTARTSSVPTNAPRSTIRSRSSPVPPVMPSTPPTKASSKSRATIRC